MRHGGAEITDWELETVTIDGVPALRMAVEGTLGPSELYFRRDADRVEPWDPERSGDGPGWVDLVDSEAHLVTQILERRGYMFPDAME